MTSKSLWERTALEVWEVKEQKSAVGIRNVTLRTVLGAGSRGLAAPCPRSLTERPALWSHVGALGLDRGAGPARAAGASAALPRGVHQMAAGNQVCTPIGATGPGKECIEGKMNSVLGELILRNAA